MKKVSLFGAGAIALAALFAAAGCGGEIPDKKAPAYDSPDATLTISGTDTQSGALSADLFGVFLEDINYASQALDDNMVENGSFQTDSGLSLQNKSFPATYGWTAGGGARLSVVTEDSPLGELYAYGANTVAEHARVEAPANGTLSNSGYVPAPMAVKEGTEYVFSAFVKSSADLTLTAEITDGETVFASVAIPVSGGWKKYERTVTASGTKDSGLSLKLTFSAAATVGLDGVAFKTTDATAGIKNYLYKAVEELSPAFVRFPGGCVTEGEDITQTFDWKNSIGAVQSGGNAGDDVVPAFTYTLNTADGERTVTTYGEEIARTPNVNLWQNNGSEYYPLDYALGFYDYFLLCESLGAKALPVVSCGLSCQGQSPGNPLAGRHGKGVEDYIRDAADLIEFAKGAENTKWGAVRKNMGHPEPFAMDYLGVGNEQWNGGTTASDYFTSYYEKFLENEYFTDMCEEYGIKLIVGNHQELIHCEGSLDTATNKPRTSGVAKDAAAAYMANGKIESLGEYGVQDHHYYNTPADFLLHTHMYDNYAREGADRYEVFVGEYSANNTHNVAGYNGQYVVNGWLSALSEAAMMTGFERNGDIVKLAAYAPMFSPVDGSMRHWGVNMMLYTNTELVRTANYYVQQMFMRDTGTRKLLAELSFADGVSPTFALAQGNARIAALERVSYSASIDEATGDYIIRLVNADENEDVRLNIDLGKAFGIADVTDILGAYGDANSLTETPVYPAYYTVGGFSGHTAGILLPAAGVMTLRFRNK